MTEDLVTVATCSLDIQAQAMRWALEQAGLQVFLADENLVNTNWLLGNAVGGIKVQVPSSQVEPATKLLEENPHLLNSPPLGEPNQADDDGSSEGPALCLSCGAAMGEGVDRCAACGWSYAEVKEGDEAGGADGT